MSLPEELPCHLFRQMMCGVIALLSICATSARAGIVFQDNFNRTGALNGSTPSFTTGGTWTANSGFTTDGAKVSASFPLTGFHEAAYVSMPVSITSGNIYTLYATTYRGLSTDDAATMLFGFFDAAPSWSQVGGGAIVDEGHAIAIAPRNNRLAISTVLNGTFNGSEIGVADGTNGTTFGVRLYETAPNTWSAVAVELAPTNQLLLGQGSPVSVSVANIATIGMFSASLLPPYIDNLTLDVTPVSTSPVPEPSSLALLGMGITGLCGYNWRRKRQLTA